MSRLIRTAIMCCIGFGISAPAQGGGSPSAFDPVFDPVVKPVSYRAQYTPYTTSYTPYYTSYTPYYTGYTPYTTWYSGFFGIPYSSSYAPAACCGCASSCSSCGYGCSSCAGGCASGMCASGNCATGACGATTTNMTTSGAIGPTPDPSIQSNSFESRLEAVERKLGIRGNQPNTYAPEDNFRGRNRNGTGTNNGNQEGFSSPVRPNSEEMYQKNEKVNLGTPDDGKSKETVIPQKPAPMPPLDDKTTMRMDTRVTSRAVSPRERLATTTTAAKSKPAVAAVPKPARGVEVDAGLEKVYVARQ